MELVPTYVFSGGGTGGHLFPGIAVAEELSARDGSARILFVGTDRAVEHAVLAPYGYQRLVLPVESPGNVWRHPIRCCLRNWRAYRLAKDLLKRQRPDAVLGLGGFVSVPLVFAASRKRIPILLLEQNVIPGRATRWLSRRASGVCLSFPQTEVLLPSANETWLTGNPLRREIIELGPGRTPMGAADRPVLLVLGGSQGATALNQALLKTVTALHQNLSGWLIVHQTGPRDVVEVRRRYGDLGVNYVVEPFFDNLPHWCRQAHVAVSRAGATTLAELACAGIPTVLVPYPHATDDHQRLNAQHYEDGGGARVVEQHAEFPAFADELARILSDVLSDLGLRQRMQSAMWELARPRAAAVVAERLLTLAGRSVADRETSASPAARLRAG